MLATIGTDILLSQTIKYSLGYSQVNHVNKTKPIQMSFYELALNARHPTTIKDLNIGTPIPPLDPSYRLKAVHMELIKFPNVMVICCSCLNHIKKCCKHDCPTEV